MLWLRKVFPGVIFANSNTPDKRYRICLSEKEIPEVFKKNMLDRYCDRPDRNMNGRYTIIIDMCSAEFLRYYTYRSRNRNDCQPKELDDTLIEINHSEVN